MKNKKIIMFFIIAILFLLSFGISYAYFMVVLSGNDNAKDVIATTGTLSINYTDGNEINSANVIPGWTTTKTLVVSNTGTLGAYYKLELIDVVNTFINDEFTYSISCISNIDTCDGLSETPLPISNDSLLYGIYIRVGEVHSYEITFSFIETNSVQNYNQGKTFAGKINVLESDELITLSGILKNSSNEVIPNAGIELHSRVIHTTTDADGFYTLYAVEQGTHELNVYDEHDELLANKTIVIGKTENNSSVNGDTLLVNNTEQNKMLSTKVDTINQESLNIE